MKRFMLCFASLCLLTSLSAEQTEQPEQKAKLEEKKEEKDTGPLIIGTILHSIVPNILNAFAAKEADDDEEIIHSISSAVQGTGALILALSKAFKHNPDLTPEQCLLAYLQSSQGTLFLSKHRSLI